MALLNHYFHTALAVKMEYFPHLLPLSEAMTTKPTYVTRITAAQQQIATYQPPNTA